MSDPVLRLTQADKGDDRYSINVSFEGPDIPRHTATAEFGFLFTAQDREELRWYLEDYLQHAADPASKIAARIEGRISEIGVALFKEIFHNNDDIRDLWAEVRQLLSKTRVEIISDVQGATTIPWELLRDPKTNVPLALRAQEFVRATHNSAQHSQLPRTDSGTIRILLVICRPGGSNDVPFRSVASRLIKGLGATTIGKDAYRLDLLRPPTFEQLGKVLRDANEKGRPYHAVHFDGHGTYGTGHSSNVDSPPQHGLQGYLLFENPSRTDNCQLIGGPALGGMLVETNVTVLILNACRSAHAEAPAMPMLQLETSETPDIHARVRAMGSLAQQVIDAGVAGVVAMRYNVYVVTAAQFVADLYTSLASGQTLGEAVSCGRKQLEAEPLREIAYEPRSLQDWMVPVVYESASVSLFPQTPEQETPRIAITAEATASVVKGLDRELERRPDVGFFGRDETLLALDRAFDTESVVLLHAYAGSGKTSSGSEFARWYHLTEGVTGPILFTSFEQKATLSQILNNTIGRVFDHRLKMSGVQWMSLDSKQRLEVSLQILSQIPVLWIWDNVEPIAGFPTGSQSAWFDSEQRELSDFLRSASRTKAKFLLTSRRDERTWLGDLAVRIKLPPMAMQERVQMARALAAKYGRKLSNVEDWMPLLRFTGGNPLTVTVLVRQAIRDGLKLESKEQVESFVGRLRAGEAAFSDEESEGRERSLGASLSYGFAHGFNDLERARLALLHLFQGFVDVDPLTVMGDVISDWCLPEVRGLTREDGIALLDKAVDVGILTAIGGGYYVIHPAIPWFFKGLFETNYPGLTQGGISPRLCAIRAFTEGMNRAGHYYFNKYQEGKREMIQYLSGEEVNILHGLRMARENHWLHCVPGMMQGLFCLYRHTGRGTDLARIVDEVVPEFENSDGSGPAPDLEEEWSLLVGYRVYLAKEALQLAEAERLQRQVVAIAREHVKTLPNNENKWAVQRLAQATGILANILREQRKSECILAYKEDFGLSMSIGDHAGAADTALDMGTAYKDLSQIRDLEKSEEWYRHSAQLYEQNDPLGRARALHQQGLVAYERFKEAVAGGREPAEVTSYLTAALNLMKKSLEIAPPDEVSERSVGFNNLAEVYRRMGHLDRAIENYERAIQYAQQGSSPK